MTEPPLRLRQESMSSIRDFTALTSRSAPWRVGVVARGGVATGGGGDAEGA